MVFLGHVRAELAEQQRNVVFAFAQGRDIDRNLLQAVVEVFAETASPHSCHQVDIGGGHDADIYFQCSGGTHGDDLAVLEHTQQLHLHRQGQLANLVEENGAAVGLLEIAFAVLFGTGESPFHMAEQLALDGAFGYGAAVHGNQSAPLFGMFAQAVLVDDAREDVFAHAALAGDEDAEVGGGHLDGLVDGKEQFGVVADNAVA